MNTNTPAPDQIYGYDVVDSSGSKIGDVDGVWVDDATSALEFIGVKTGFLMGKTHLIPAENAQFSGNSIQVPYSKDQVHDAPSFGTNDELSPDDENQIYSYYGLDRSTQASPTGYAGGTGTTGTVDTTTTGTTDTLDTVDTTGTRDRDYVTTDRTTTGDVATGRADLDTGDHDLVLSEEELAVGKRQVEAGRVRLRKVVRTEQVTEPIELRREEIQIERVDATGAEVPTDAFQEEEIEVPVMREEPVVATEAHVTGRVHVEKDVETEQRTIDGEVRREDVEVDRDVDTTTGGVGGTRSTGYDDTTTGGGGTTDRGESLTDRVRDTIRRDDNR